MSEKIQNLLDNSIWQTIEGNYHFWQTPLIEYLSYFFIDKCHSVYEFGCGSGSLIYTARNKGYLGGYLGTDYSDNLLKMARHNNPQESFKIFNLLTDTDEENIVDCTVCLDTFDNVYPYKHGLEQMRKLSKKYAVITLWQGFLANNNIRFNEAGGWNVNAYAKDEWYKTLEEVGFKILVDAEMNHYVEQLGRLFYQHLFILDVCKE